MQFKRVIDTKSKPFKQAWNLYKSSFPSDERRTLAQERTLFGKIGHEFYATYEKWGFVGFIELWNIEEFVFIHYLAISARKRGKGYGSKILRSIIATTVVPIILEIEPPKTLDQKKRITFYQKQGFHLNTFQFIQPAYSKNKRPVSLLLMSYPKKLSRREFNKIKKTIYRQVYFLKS